MMYLQYNLDICWLLVSVVSQSYPNGIHFLPPIRRNDCIIPPKADNKPTRTSWSLFSSEFLDISLHY